MPHELLGGDQHLHPVIGGLKYCQCWADCCIDIQTMECVCTQGCDCRKKGSVVAPIRSAPPASPKPEHACENCGTEVFRKGTRGRFPKLCPECKTK